jgi:NAD(P)-dependent dehydrogenase (short-subunit alcohol dehydrogenase family)
MIDLKSFQNTSFDLSGKNSLVTGAAGLLGLQHSIALAHAGSKVVMTDVDGSRLEEAAEIVYKEVGVEVIALELDVSNPISVSRLRNTLEGMGIVITRLINNAAIDPKVKSDSTVQSSARLELFDPEQFDLEVKVGLTGAILCASEFGPIMADAGDGIILNIASDLSVISPDQRLYKKDGIDELEQPVKPVSYSVIKSGLVGLTRYLSTYWADQNVRSNALSPGGVYTSQDDEFVTRLNNLIPLGRMAKCDEYRGIIQFMCSDAAMYLNGQNIVMDGGRSVL